MTVPYLLHALSPLHAGTGQALDVVDLPIARLCATGIPIVPGSSVKGVLRDARRPLTQSALEYRSWRAVFGPEQSRAAEHAGALIVSDARLLALPVRSLRGTFAWVSSPLLLDLARRDIGLGAPAAVPAFTDPGGGARVAAVSGAEASINLHVRAARGDQSASERWVFLEELDLKAEKSDEVAAWAAWLAPHVESEEGSLLFKQRFAVVDDETMTYLWETATQIDARVRLNEETRTVARRALWMEESLPPETLLLGVLAAEQSRYKEQGMSPVEVLDWTLQGQPALQFGGKATVGRGRCRMVRLPGWGA